MKMHEAIAERRLRLGLSPTQAAALGPSRSKWNVLEAPGSPGLDRLRPKTLLEVARTLKWPHYWRDVVPDELVSWPVDAPAAAPSHPEDDVSRDPEIVLVTASQRARAEYAAALEAAEIVLGEHGALADAQVAELERLARDTTEALDNELSFYTGQSVALGKHIERIDKELKAIRRTQQRIGKQPSFADIKRDRQGRRAKPGTVSTVEHESVGGRQAAHGGNPKAKATQVTTTRPRVTHAEPDPVDPAPEDD